jgi:hypothetical protein
VRIALVIVTLIVAVLGWLARGTVHASITAAAVGLLLIAAILQLLLERRDRAQAARGTFTGVLESPGQVLLSPDGVNRPRLEMADSGSILEYAGPKGEPLLRIFQDNSLTIAVKDGQVVVSCLIRSEDGSAVAELIENEWKVNPHNSFDRNYSKDALEVRDKSGDIVLQVNVLSDRVQFQGKFFDGKGNGFGIGKGVDPDTGQVGGIFEITGWRRPRLTMSIQPMFRYPSERHLGERVRR